MTPMISLLKIYGAKTIGFLGENTDAMNMICQGARSQALGNRITILSEQSIPQLSFAASKLAQENNALRNALIALQTVNPDVVIGCVYQVTSFTSHTQITQCTKGMVWY